MIDTTNVTRTITSTAPDGSSNIQNHQNGLLISSVHSVLGETTYQYDEFNRLKSETRTINNVAQTSTYSYTANGQAKTITDSSLEYV